MDRDDLGFCLVRPLNSPCWVIRYRDPATGAKRQKSTRTTNKRDAERILGKFRDDLLAGRYAPTSNLTWHRFRERYEAEVLPSLAVKTRLKVATILNAVETLVKPLRLRDLSADKLSVFQAKLREGGRSETTVLGYQAHLRSALAWAVEMGMLPSVPKIKKPERAKQSSVMKGRPISREEFERMLDKAADVVGADAAQSWKHYLEGLWWSGLRLSESLDLYWDDDGKLCAMIDRGELLLRIPAELEKANKDRLLPIAPEFAEFLLRTPEAERSGRVFKLKPKKVRGERMTADRVTRIVSAIGQAASVVVDKGRNRFATAHDLRRSFGERWAELVMPQVLMELMRHASINTTLRFYVGRNARRTSKVVREAYNAARQRGAAAGEASQGDAFGDTHPNGGQNDQMTNPEVVYRQGVANTPGWNRTINLRIRSFGGAIQPPRRKWRTVRALRHISGRDRQREFGDLRVFRRFRLADRNRQLGISARIHESTLRGYMPPARSPRSCAPTPKMILGAAGVTTSNQKKGGRANGNESATERTDVGEQLWGGAGPDRRGRYWAAGAFAR